MPPRIISEADEAELNRIKVRLVNDVWAGEGGALKEESRAQQRKRWECLHGDIEFLRVTLEQILHIDLTINEDEQKIDFPFSENGGGK